MADNLLACLVVGGSTLICTRSSEVAEEGPEEFVGPSFVASIRAAAEAGSDPVDLPKQIK